MSQVYRILHLAKFYPPEYGGIESVTEALAEDHANAGHRVEVVCFTREASDVATYGTLTIRRLACIGKLSSQPLSLSYIFAAVRSARSADVVHAHTPNLLASLATLFTRRSAKVVVHWHADIAGKGILGVLTRPLEKLMLGRCDAVVCTSASYLETSPALRQFRSKCSVIPLGISDMVSKDAGAPENLFEEIIEPYIIFVGRLVPYKGLDNLFRSVAAMTSKVRCIIVGVGPEEPRLRSLADELGVTGQIHFLGNVDHNRLNRLVSGARIFCLTSNNRLEAFGVVLLEAMRAGCPTVSMDIPGSGVSWVNEAGIVVPQGDVVAFAQALDRIAGDPNERAVLGAAARERFVTNFIRSRMSARFLALYERLIKEG